MKSRLHLIWGPPGSGKTGTLCGIVANWHKLHPQEKILVCAPSNHAADHIAE